MGGFDSATDDPMMRVPRDDRGRGRSSVRPPPSPFAVPEDGDAVREIEHFVEPVGDEMTPAPSAAS